jgi:hypothetical protein
MADEDEAAAVRAMIEKFYKVGGVSVPPSLAINEGVAAVFVVMLEEAAKCSKAMNFVPTPLTGFQPLKWLGSQARRALFGALIPRLDIKCVRAVIWKWRTKLEAASQNASYGRIVARLNA